MGVLKRPKRGSSLEDLLVEGSQVAAGGVGSIQASEVEGKPAVDILGCVLLYFISYIFDTPAQGAIHPISGQRALDRPEQYDTLVVARWRRKSGCAALR